MQMQHEHQMNQMAQNHHQQAMAHGDQSDMKTELIFPDL